MSGSSKSRKDVALVGPELPGTDKRPVVRIQNFDDREPVTSLGMLSILQEGQDAEGEVIKLMPREGDAPFYDLEIQGGETGTHKGPAKVNSGAYRTGWDHIFGGKENLN